MTNQIEDADFIIIGSGSAGSAMAYRLSEDKKYSVLVLEYGGTDIGPFIQMPAALSFPMNMKRYDWGYLAEPEATLNNRRLVCPRGKVIGGSSSINGMIYVRGHAGDYAHWEEKGATGWNYANVLPYFRRMEHWHEGGHTPDFEDGGFRGSDGPLHVTRGSRQNPLHHAFVKAAEEAGYDATADYNGYQQEGFGPADMTIWKGQRWSAANAYLKPAIKNHGVRLIKGALVDKIDITNGRADSVTFQQGGQTITARAKREIILAAGAINSPQIMQRSGIGPGQILQQAGVEVIVDRPGVGANLQDHLEVYFQVHCLKPITLNKHMNLFSKGLIGLRWLLNQSGIGASNQFETLGFIRSDKGISYPDIQFHFLPAAVRYDGKAAADGHGFQMHIGPMRSKSRGHVHIRNADIHTAPEIRFNYMSHADDWVEFRQCIRLGREILSMPAMDEFRGDEIQPGNHVISDDAIDDFIREHAESAYHPCGTMRIGQASDPMAVVDPECRVIGVDGLRVADSSIFPRITNGNLNAPSIMVGEKASDFILGRQPLPPVNLTPHHSPDWENRQR